MVTLEALEPRLLLSGSAGAVPGEAMVSPDEAIVRRRARVPAVRIGFAQVLESDAGQTAVMTFKVRRSGPLAQLGRARVRYATAEAPAGAAVPSAVQGSDYQATTGVVRFRPGQRLAQITVTVLGNNAAQSNRLLAVELSGARKVQIKRGTGLGVIVDDDSPGADLQVLGQSLVSNADNLITMQLTLRNQGGSTSQNGRVLFVATATGFPGLSPPDDPTIPPGPVFRLLEQYNLAGIAPGATVVRTFIFDTNAAIHCTDAAGRTDFGGYIQVRATNEVNSSNNTAAMVSDALLPDDDTEFGQGCSSGWQTTPP